MQEVNLNSIPFNLPRIIFSDYEDDITKEVIKAQGIEFSYQFLEYYLGEIIFRKRRKINGKRHDNE